MIVPKWFSKELRVIDPSYRVEEPEDHDGYFIIKDIDLSLSIDDGKSLSIPGGDKDRLRARGSLPVLWFPGSPSQACLDKLREMKFQALQLGIFDNPTDELAYYQKLKRDAKKKKEEVAVDMISEGIVEGDKIGKRRTFNYSNQVFTKEK